MAVITEGLISPHTYTHSRVPFISSPTPILEILRRDQEKNFWKNAGSVPRLVPRPKTKTSEETTDAPAFMSVIIPWQSPAQNEVRS